MPEVGVRELRDHLSRYLAEVRDGAEVVVTEHGRAVARLMGLAHERPIDRLIAEGLVTRATTVRRRPNRRVAADGSISQLVANQRR